MTAGARASASNDARDADATASTLNYVLGKRHMKSWMVAPVNPGPAPANPGPAPSIVPPPDLTAPPAPAAPANKRGRGRPRKHPKPRVDSQQHVTQPASPTNTPLIERLPSSNSTSPQLANIATAHQLNDGHGNADVAVFPYADVAVSPHADVAVSPHADVAVSPHADVAVFPHAHVAVFPSPTPSEEDMHTARLQDNGNRSRPRVSIDAFDFASANTPNCSGMPRETVHQSSVGQIPPPKRPAGGFSVPVEKRVRTDAAPQDLPVAATTAPPVQRPPHVSDFTLRFLMPHAQRGGLSVVQRPNSETPLDQHSYEQVVRPQIIQAAHPQSSRAIPSTVHGPHGWHPHQNETHISASPHPQTFGITTPGAQQIAQPHYMPSSQHPSPSHGVWYSPEVCMVRLNNFKALFTVEHTCCLDRLRRQVLEEAINAQDWAYLTLHQYHCLMSHSRQSLPLSLQCNTNMAAAYALIRDVLGDNTRLCAPVMELFCNFPFPIQQIRATWPLKAQHAEHDFALFVNHSSAIGTLRLKSERRRIPPTPGELADCKIFSMTFQRLLVRSIIRSLWVGYPELPVRRQHEDRTMQAWERQVLNLQQSRTRGQFRDRQQVEDELRSWGLAFTHCTRLLEAALQIQGSQQGNPGSPPIHLQQQQQQRRQQPQLPISQATNTPIEDIAMSFHRQQRPFHEPRHRAASHIVPTAQSAQAATPLLPRPGLVQPQQRVPNPSRFGLHQAHLRSPVLHSPNLPSPVYYFWQGFIRKPQRFLNPNTKIEKMTFRFAEKEMNFVAQAMASVPGAPDRRLVVDENYKMIRLSCIKWASDEPPSDAAWAVAEQSWIPCSYFSFNGTSLQLRKKLYWGKDLPVDLTGLVRPGDNTLEISVMSNSDDTTHRTYLVAIEFLGVMTQASIKRSCQRNRISAEKTVADIKRKLSVRSTDDDEISIVDSTLTIHLRDPFSASKISDTPVRGTACRHNECFDLDTFLETRPRKGDVSAADQWRCPICRADARPNVLVVDEFLVRVREELEKKGLLETRAIIVAQDGSLKPKAEERDPNSVQDHDSPEPMLTATKPKSPFVYEIVDLDSD
ncbi:hypothetical protein EJ07DRAFT_158032 [Lizonia empirigonia]|nr:hypothetical protein EJ07DRAFT_158032 [Lizonia empirigonia]